MAIIIIDGDESVYDIDELSYDPTTEKEEYKTPLIIVSFEVRNLCGILREVSFAQSAVYFDRVKRASLEGATTLHFLTLNESLEISDGGIKKGGWV